MRIEVAIPTYRRPVVETLKIYPDAVVFCDSTDYEVLREVHPDATFHVMPDGVQGNIARVRNYIMDWACAEGADWVFSFDDDIRLIITVSWSNGHVVVEEFKGASPEVFSLIALGCQMADDVGTPVWGFNPHGDIIAAYYARIIRFSGFISGAAFGIRTDCGLRFWEENPFSEDYDMSLQAINRYGACLVLDFVCVSHRMVVEGGCSMTRTPEVELESKKLLVERWGSDVVRLVYTSRRGRKAGNGRDVPVARIKTEPLGVTG